MNASTPSVCSLRAYAPLSCFALYKSHFRILKIVSLSKVQTKKWGGKKAIPAYLFKGTKRKLFFRVATIRWTKEKQSNLIPWYEIYDSKSTHNSLKMNWISRSRLATLAAAECVSGLQNFSAWRKAITSSFKKKKTFFLRKENKKLEFSFSVTKIWAGSFRESIPNQITLSPGRIAENSLGKKFTYFFGCFQSLVELLLLGHVMVDVGEDFSKLLFLVHALRFVHIKVVVGGRAGRCKVKKRWYRIGLYSVYSTVFLLCIVSACCCCCC